MEVEMQVSGGTLRRFGPGQVFTNHQKTKEQRFSLPFTSFGALNFSDETILHKAILLTWRHV